MSAQIQPQDFPFSPEFTAGDLLAIISRVWCNFSADEMTLANPTSVQDLTGPVLHASISINGDWQGKVQLGCQVDLAIEIAAEIFGPQDHELALANARDLLGEVANMTAGCVTELMAGSQTLSLPTTTDLNGQGTTIPGERITGELDLVCKSKPVRLIIVTTDGQGPQASAGE